MVSINKLFSKSYVDLKNRFGIYVALSFITIFALTLILMGNSSLVDSLSIEGNSIYSEVVDSANTNVPITIYPQIISLLSSFLIWLASLFAILLLGFSFTISSLKSKLKLSSKFLIYSTLSSIVGGLILSYIFRPLYMELIIFFTAILYSLIYLVLFLRKNYALFLDTMKHIYPRLIIYISSYYFIVLILLFVKIIFVKLTIYSFLKVLMTSLDLLILFVFLHLLFNSVTSFSKKKKTFGSIFLNSLSNKSCLKVTALVSIVIIITYFFLLILNLIPYTGILILIIVYIEFSLGMVYLQKVLLGVNK